VCAVTFATQLTSRPVCTAAWNATTAPASDISASSTTTSLTLYGSAAENGEKINVTCRGYK
jgi:hypothetical protein